jgi:anti-anti-sigma factor
VSPKSQTITIASDISELSHVAAMVDEFCTGLATTAADISALHLALEEIVTNVITHGYRDARHSFAITLQTTTTDRIRATVTDDAPPYNPLARPEVNTSLALEERNIGGLGVHLVKKLMDLCLYEHRDGRNIFAIERNLGRSSASLNITTSRLEASAVLAFTGRLDGLTSPEAEKQVTALIKSGIRIIDFNLSALDYVSSAGLRIFILTAKSLKQAGGGAKFIGLKASVREVFDVSGLLTVLDVS